MEGVELVRMIMIRAEVLECQNKQIPIRAAVVDLQVSPRLEMVGGGRHEDFGPGAGGFSTDSNGSASQAYKESVQSNPSRHYGENTGVEGVGDLRGMDSDVREAYERGAFDSDSRDDNFGHNHQGGDDNGSTYSRFGGDGGEGNINIGSVFGAFFSQSYSDSDDSDPRRGSGVSEQSRSGQPAPSPTATEIAKSRGIELHDSVYDPRTNENLGGKKNPVVEAKAAMHAAINQALDQEVWDEPLDARYKELDRVLANNNLVSDPHQQPIEHVTEAELAELTATYDNLLKAQVSAFLSEADSMVREKRDIQITFGEADSILDDRELGNRHELALAHSINIIGSTQEISELTKRAGADQPSSEHTSRDNGGIPFAAGGMSMSGFAATIPTSINLVSTDYIRNGELLDPGGILTHELSHSAEGLIINYDMAFTNRDDLTYVQRKDIERGADWAKFSRGERLETSHLPQPTTKQQKESLEYITTITELVAFYENQGEEFTAELLSRDTGIPLAEAREFVRQAYQSDDVQNMVFTMEAAAGHILDTLE